MARGPQFVRYFAPVIEALKELGGSGRPSEVRDVIAQRLKISEHERAIVNKSGASRFENRVHWARFYLAKAGYLDSSTRGVWSLTEKGQAVTKMTHDDALAIFNELHSQFAADRNNVANGSSSTSTAETDEKIAPSPTLAVLDLSACMS
jgi:restriction system protein